MLYGKKKDKVKCTNTEALGQDTKTVMAEYKI